MEQMSVAEKFFRTASDLQQLFKDRETEHALDVEFFTARIEEKDKEIEALEDKLAEKSREIFELKNGQAVVELNELLHSQKLKCDEMCADLLEKDNVISGLERKVSDLRLVEQDQDYQLAMKDVEVVELKKKVSALNVSIEEMSVQLAAMENDYHDQKKKLDRASQVLAEKEKKEKEQTGVASRLTSVAQLSHPHVHVDAMTSQASNKSGYFVIPC